MATTVLVKFNALDNFHETQQSIGKTAVMIDQLESQHNTFASNATASLKSLIPSWQQVGAAALGIVAGIAAVGTAILALGQRGAEVNDVTDAFNHLNERAGRDGPVALEALRRGVGGLLTDFDLMKPMNAALSAGFQLNATDAYTLTRAAWVLSDAQGKDLKESYEVIAKAMATGKVAALAGLGVTVEQKGAALDLKAALAAEGEVMLTSTQKAVARQAAMEALTKVVLAAGDQELDFGEKITRAKVQLANMTDSLGAAIASSPVVGKAMDSIGNALQNAFGANQTATIKTLVDGVNKFAIVLVDLASAGVTAAGVLGRAWSGLQLIFSGTLSIVASVGLGFANLVAGAAELAAKIPGVGSQFAGVSAKARDLANFMGGVQQSFHDQAMEALEGVKGNSAYQKTLDTVSDGLGTMRASMITASHAQVEAGAIARNLTKDTTEHSESVRVNTEHTKKLAAEIEKHTEAARKNEAGLFGLNTTFGHLDKTELDHIKTVLADAEAFKVLQAKISDVERVSWVANFGFKGMADGLENLGEKSTEIDQVKKRLEDVTRSTELFYDALYNLSTGSGGVPGAIAALKQLSASWKDLSADERNGAIASTALSAGFDALASATANAETKKGQVMHYAAVGAKWGSIVPGLGTLAGFGVGALVGALKVSPVEIAAREEYATWQGKIVALFDQMATGSQKNEAAGRDWAKVNIVVRDAYEKIGLTGDQAMKDISVALDATHHTADEVDAALKTINDTLMASKKYEEDFAAAMAGIDVATKGLGSTIDEVGVGIPDFLQPMLDDLMEAPNLTDEVKKSISGLRDSASPDFAKLEALAKSYGGEIDQLGPKFQQAHVTADATKWITDYEKLKAAGADMNGVLSFMADEASHVVQESIKFGTTIPENMKPMLESLAGSGQLLDENKKQITDISTLHFGPAVSTDVDRLKGAIELLAQAIDKIPSKLDAVASIKIPPKTLDVKIVYDDPGYTPGAPPIIPGHDGEVFSRGSLLPFVSSRAGSSTAPAARAGSGRAATSGGGDTALRTAVEGLRADMRRSQVFMQETLVKTVKAAVQQRVA